MRIIVRISQGSASFEGGEVGPAPALDLADRLERSCVQQFEQSNQGPAPAAGSAWIWAVVAIELAGSLLDAMQRHVVTRPMPIR
jgi:hypothetical protein